MTRTKAIGSGVLICFPVCRVRVGRWELNGCLGWASAPTAIVSTGRYDPAMRTDQDLADGPTAAIGRPAPGGGVSTTETISAGIMGAGIVRFKLICPSTTVVWDTPANAGFDEATVVARLRALRADGHDYELIDGDALGDQERGELYGQASIALARAGNRYRIRQVFGSGRHGGGDHLGLGVPALLVLADGEPVDVYPHQVGGEHQTIRGYLNALSQQLAAGRSQPG